MTPEEEIAALRKQVAELTEMVAYLTKNFMVKNQNKRTLISCLYWKVMTVFLARQSKLANKAAPQIKYRQRKSVKNPARKLKPPFGG
ncbi:hypothetical protein ATO00_13570 [Loigolactobacillus coryniformis subsp. coryniformis]|nr:hypothetical protein ATO00_13570 [Loigolactobacillus coryniformis subsp. coryniformis]